VIPEDLLFTSIAELGDAYRSRALSPCELVDTLLDRISDMDATLNSYVTVLEQSLREDARRAERRLRADTDTLPPLLGIPISVKDNIATAGVRTTAGSRILRDWVPDHDAPSVGRLREAGALLVGKTNLFEFAYGEAHEDYGAVRNPWSLDRSTAGSSSGSAASVAGGLGWGSLATDTGGSIRVPAAFCGVVGLKPTFGAIPSAGMISTSWTVCHVGVIARSVDDAARLFAAAAGRRSPERADTDLRGVRLAMLGSQATELVDQEIRAAVHAASDHFEEAGAILRPVGLPDLVLVRALLWTIASAEASDIHEERLRTHRDQYHPTVRDRLERGYDIPAPYYVRAQRVRQWLIEQVDQALTGFDALLLPTSPILPYPLGARWVDVGGTEEETGQAVTRYTPLASLTGRPAVSIPCGASSSGLPISLQLVGHPNEEEVLLRVAAAYEKASGWNERPRAITVPAGVRDA